MIFRYQGRTKTGAQKKGIIDAANRNAAIAKLRSQGINPRTIEASNSIWHYELSFGKKVKHKDFIIYLRQYATLIRAGITVVDATHILQQQTSSKP
ncbi:MAG TPA: type II secretion system F family protein, partial [Metalysinibacillus sp.]